MLQTAQFCVVKILLDTRSQQTFISDRVINELKLKPLSQVDMRVSKFLNTEESNMTLNEYEIVVKPYILMKEKLLLHSEY